MNDMFQVDYLPEEKEIRINLPEEVWNSNVALVFSNDYQQDMIAYRWESEAEHDG